MTRMIPSGSAADGTNTYHATCLVLQRQPREPGNLLDGQNEYVYCAEASGCVSKAQVSFISSRR